MLEGVLDVIYNPARTQLLLDAEAFQIPCANGLWMLVAQAKESAEYFTGKSIDDARYCQNLRNPRRPDGKHRPHRNAGVRKKYRRRSAGGQARQKADGCRRRNCPSCGPSPIPQIFAEDGEAVFRDWETKALSQLGKQSALVIATGRRLCDPAAKLPDASPERRDFLAETGHFQAAHRRPSPVPG